MDADIWTEGNILTKTYGQKQIVPQTYEQKQIYGHRHMDRGRDIDTDILTNTSIRT